VRELRTAIEHGVVMANGPKITVRELPMSVRQGAARNLPAGFAAPRALGEKASPLDLHETERRLIAQALASTDGNITAAAKKLGISRRTLHRKINEMKAESGEQEQKSDVSGQKSAKEPLDTRETSRETPRLASDL
jgi:DNA-binding NtrC family response regulator